MTKINPKIRISIYLVLAAAGAVAVTWGVITQDLVDALTPVIAGILAVTGGGVAAANTNVKPRETPGVGEFVGIASDAAPAILAELARLRSQVAGIAPQLPVSDVVEYVPEVAPWLDYQGQRRGE